MYHRIRLTAPTQNTIYPIYINGLLATTHKIIVSQSCDNSLYIKYLDKYGQYRFIPIDPYHGVENEATEIGRSVNYIDSMVAARGGQRSIGKQTSIRISCTTPYIPSTVDFSAAEIVNSPSVYVFYKGLWIVCFVTLAEPTIKHPKNKDMQYQIDIEIPAIPNITRL